MTAPRNEPDDRARIEAARDRWQAEALRNHSVARRETHRRTAAEARAERAEAEVRALTASASYRLGHAIVLALKSPYFLIRWVGAATARLLVRVLPESAIAAIVERSPARLRDELRRATRRGRAVARSRREPGVGVLQAVRGPGPVIIIVLPGEGTATTEAVLEAVRPTLERRAAIPVFVTFHDDFRPFRELEAAFEFIVPQEDWSRQGLGDGWYAYVDDRLDDLVVAYLADDIVFLPPPPYDAPVETFFGDPAGGGEITAG